MYQPTPDDVVDAIESAVNDLGDKCSVAEIAFFGGSFTAIDRQYMISLLDATEPYIDKFYGIRVSTRPDCIDDETLDILKRYRVTTIELGAQSMDNEVLMSNNRGHSAVQVITASKMIKNKGFALGLQMMTGLYKSTIEKDIYTANEFIKLRPDCVRIYPTVVVKDTKLMELFQKGEYPIYSLQTSIELCSKILMMFYRENIDVIRLGLHYSDSLVKNSVGDNYHPAFKEMCENKIFLDEIQRQLEKVNSKDIILVVNKKSMSKLVGQNKCNINKLNEMNYNVKIICDDNLDKYDVIVKEQG